MDKNTEATCQYYGDRYDVIFKHIFQRSEKLQLGVPEDRKCRFCGKSKPEVTFKKIAHAISELLGNRGLTSNYECDSCNELFGGGIESDLGEWSKPMRTFMRIAGKNGVPTLKKSSQGGWRIDATSDELNIKSYESDPFYETDEAHKRVTFTLKRGSFTPVAVYKAFVKIGLTLLPPEELGPFEKTLAWIRNSDHTQPFIESAPIVCTFHNGPMPNDRLAAVVLRRKSGIIDAPYAFLILGFGNEVFQLMLPAPAEDAVLNGQRFDIPPFPMPYGPDTAVYRKAASRLIDMTGREIVRGETVKIAVRYELATKIGYPQEPDVASGDTGVIRDDEA